MRNGTAILNIEHTLGPGKWGNLDSSTELYPTAMLTIANQLEQLFSHHPYPRFPQIPENRPHISVTYWITAYAYWRKGMLGPRM